MSSSVGERAPLHRTFVFPRVWKPPLMSCIAKVSRVGPRYRKAMSTLSGQTRRDEGTLARCWELSRGV